MTSRSLAPMRRRDVWERVFKYLKKIIHKSDIEKKRIVQMKRTE